MRPAIRPFVRLSHLIVVANVPPASLPASFRSVNRAMIGASLGLWSKPEEKALVVVKLRAHGIITAPGALDYYGVRQVLPSAVPTDQIGDGFGALYIDDADFFMLDVASGWRR